MASNYEVKAVFKADTSDLDSKMSKAQDATEDINKGFDGISGKAKKIGTAIASAFAVGKILEFGMEISQTSAELQAMEAQFDQVFQGDSNAEALERIGTVSSETQIHVDRLTNAFNSFGAQTKGAGMDASQSLEATEKATRLAADSAAFYDTSLEEAQASIASFMKGK